MKKRYLTKSRFKIGFSCPTKLTYLDNPEYGNKSIDDPFLEALAQGGFQVGELVKIYHPGGIEVTTRDHEEALAETEELLKKKNVTIFEAAFRYKDFFIRVDVLKKVGDKYFLYEVKSKTWNADKDRFFQLKKAKDGSEKFMAKWIPYLVDVAFQAFVIKKSKPEWKLNSYLTLVNRQAVATVDELNQRFALIAMGNDSKNVLVKEGTDIKAVGDPILIDLPVEDQIALIWSQQHEGMSFEKFTTRLASAYCDKKFIEPKVSHDCQKCEFRIKDDMKAHGLKSGFDECWVKTGKVKLKELKKPFVFDIWKIGNTDDFIEQNVIFAEDLGDEDIEPENRKTGLSQSDRQMEQVRLIQAKDPKPYFDKSGILKEIATWTWPLHFIDFETTAPAIPFHKGFRPYSQIAFQFSHHTLDKDGTVRHQSQYINFERGKFPNFDFARALKTSLEIEEGTIFRYHNHENTVLRDIRRQILARGSEVKDAKALIKFIDSITKSGGDETEENLGERCMVDLYQLVLKFYLHPAMGKQNSIKAVLPAVLSESKFLQKIYSKPVYGSKEFPSHNFKDHAWIKFDGEKVIDPYKSLPELWEGVNTDELDLLMDEEGVSNGGAAMMAYCKMQYSQMSEEERVAIRNSLLRYCELDTMAMVMIVQHWLHASGWKA